MAKDTIMKKVFLIPVYNEEKNIPRLLSCLRDFCASRRWDFKIYAVNDGSSDGTLRELRSFQAMIPLEIVDMGRNQGPGAAFKRGFKEILKMETDDALIITLEADSTSDLGILDTMVRKAEAGVDLVLASCYAKGGAVKGTSLYRRTTSAVANFLIGLLSRRSDIRTYSSFYRVYKYSAVAELHRIYKDDFMQETGFTCAVELFLKLARLPILIEEVPMVLDCKKRIGKSKMKTIPTIFAYLRIIGTTMLRGSAFGFSEKE
jgi:dolichol-phosphate mannosyltransferase